MGDCTNGELPMKRVCGHVLAGAAVLACATTVTSACVHDNSTIFVYDVLAPQEVSNGELCTYSNDTSQLFISQGTADTDFIDFYTATYLVGNQLVPQINPQTPQTESSYVQIQGAVVRITDAAGHQLNTYTYPISSQLPPLNGTQPGYAPVIGVMTIDHDTLFSQSVQSVVNPPPPTRRGFVRLITYVRFFGQTTGGDSVESDEFEFPVNVCKGCLIQFAPQDIDSCFPVPNCLAAASMTGSGAASSLPVPCNPGQDIPIDCSQCLNVGDCNPQYPGFATTCADGGAG
jgi:hypothetical protein